MRGIDEQVAAQVEPHVSSAAVVSRRLGFVLRLRRLARAVAQDSQQGVNFSATEQSGWAWRQKNRNSALPAFSSNWPRNLIPTNVWIAASRCLASFSENRLDK